MRAALRRIFRRLPVEVAAPPRKIRRYDFSVDRAPADEQFTYMLDFGEVLHAHMHRAIY